MGKLEIRLFGPLRVTLDGARLVNFESDKDRALLAYLAVEADHAYSRMALAGLLWPEYSEAHARHNLSQALYSLRRTLGELISSAQPLFLLTPETIQLNPASETWLDVDEFTRLIDACDRHPHRSQDTCEPCLENFQQVVALYQGDFLESFSVRGSAIFDQWCLACRERYRSLACSAMTRLASCYEARGQTAQAIETIRRLAALDPLDEAACRRLMQLLTASSKRSEAISCYDNYRRRLREELGVAPDQETRLLYEHIRTKESVKAAAPARRHNLPASLSPLIGRETELADLQARLLDPTCRLLTVLGPGGSGKSRLALETARGLLARFADGVYLVNLSPLTSLEAILPSIAEAIGLQIQPQKPPQPQVQDYLRQKELLLVLDGCEAQLEGVPLVIDLMHYAPDLKVLVTSRVRLNAKNEQVYLLKGLEYPSPTDLDAATASAAVRLFASGARRVKPGFELDPLSLPAVVEICTDAEGMPLAILLAAAWAEMFSPDEILREMYRGPDFLQAEWADLPPRQRSMRASFEYSWEMLDESDQEVFQALCIFRGGFTREAAEQVGGAAPQGMRRLVDKSLIMPQEAEWYAIHTLLRQFGLEKLNDQHTASQEVHRRYSTYFLDRLPEWEAGMKGAHQLEILAILDVEINDLRPAWEWAAENQETDRLSRGLEGLCLYYELRTRFIEGKSLCQETVMSLIPSEQPQQKRLLAHLAAWESRFCRLLGEHALARPQLEEGQTLVDDLAGISLPGSNLDTRGVQALIYLETGEAVFTADLAAAQRHLGCSLELYRELGDDWRKAGVLYRLGINRGHASNYSGSHQLLSEAIELYQKLGAPSGAANAQRVMAQNQMRLGQTESALDMMRRIFAFSQASGDRVQTMLDVRTLALALMWNGMTEGVYLLLQQALTLAQDLGSRYDITFIHVVLGFYGLFTAQYVLAHHHLALAQDLAYRDGFLRELAASQFTQGCLALVEKTPQQARGVFQESIALYRQIGHLDELSWVLSLDAFCLLDSGEIEQARRHLIEALEITHSIRTYLSALFSLSVGAIWLGSQGECEKALEYYEVAAIQPVFANFHLFNELFGKSIACYTASLPADIAASARERGRGRQLLPTVDEMLSSLA